MILVKDIFALPVHRNIGQERIIIKIVVTIVGLEILYLTSKNMNNILIDFVVLLEINKQQLIIVESKHFNFIHSQNKSILHK